MSEKDFFEQFQYDPDKDLLGSGGFGTVYRAFDNVKNRYVAIKISQVKDVFGKFTLLNEVKLSEEIDDHTNVARYELGLRVKRPFPTDYAIMAYYEEGNLDMMLRKRHGELSAQEQYEIIEGLLEGIGHLHTENVIHRDLKLANILMHRTKQGHWRPKIADFGLSRQMDDYDASIANSAIGITMAYAAPEQIENKPIRKNVDLWAIGVIIYKLLTGDMPFMAIQGANSTTATVEISRKITQIELPERLNTVPEPYQTIIRRCWVKDTKDRAQSAHELLAILKSSDIHTLFHKDNYTTTTTTQTPPRVFDITNSTQDSPTPPRPTPPNPRTPTKPVLEEESEETALYYSTPPSVSALEKDSGGVSFDEEKTAVFQEEQPIARSGTIPKWVWGVVAILLLLGIAWGAGLFDKKRVPPDPCNMALFPDLDCDGDGVLNKNDKLPKDPKNGATTKPEAGTGTLDPNGDEDGDGVKNSEDRCPYKKGSQSSLGCIPD